MTHKTISLPRNFSKFITIFIFTTTLLLTASSAFAQAPSEINSHSHLPGNDLRPATPKRAETISDEARIAAAMSEIADTTTVVTPSDNFLSARVVTGRAGYVITNNTYATKEAGEPDHAGIASGNSIWFVWQAPTTCRVVLATQYGSDFDTSLAVYTGARVDALTEVARGVGYQTAAGAQSFLGFYATAGQLYYIVVDGSRRDPSRPANGAVKLAWTTRDPGRIFFQSNRDGNQEIYSMNSAGGDIRRLTNSASADTDPAVSPDGSRVAFVSARDGDAEIYTMNADGSDVRQVTANTFPDYQPAWSPDGARLTFSGYRQTDYSEFTGLYLMDADGSNLRSLGSSSSGFASPTWSPDNTTIAFEEDGSISSVSVADSKRTPLALAGVGRNESPAYSPDGTRIAFISTRDGNPELYIMNSDGSGQTRLTTSPEAESAPAWSPDATTIIYGFDRGNTEIYTLGVPGGTPSRLTTHSATDGAPSWSPETRTLNSSNRILVTSYRDGYAGLYRMNRDGSAITPFIPRALNARYSSDGTRIVYSGYEYGATQYHLYIANADGTGAQRLTTSMDLPAGGSLNNTEPSFSPDGARVVFRRTIYTPTEGSSDEIYVINADSTGEQSLTQSRRNYTPVFSPDGSRIAFTSLRDGNTEIYVMNHDGTLQQRLTENPGEDRQPEWSPDGTRIGFMSNRPSSALTDIYSMTPDGGDLRRLTTDPGYEQMPAYSPDNDEMLYLSQLEGFQSAIHSMNADGTRHAPLLLDTRAMTQPRWEPPTSAARPTLAIEDASRTEGNAGTSALIFNVRLSVASDSAVSVNYTTANNTANAPSDYTQVSGTLNFAPGETLKTVSVTIKGDTFIEADETFFVTLATPAGATLARSAATGTITSDDFAPTTLAAIADAYVKGATPDQNFGALGELQIKRTLNPGSGKGRQAYLRFDTSGVTGTITRATLRVYGRLNAVNTNVPLAAFPVSNATWTETGLTWANKPAPNAPSALAQVVVTDTTARWYELDITSFIQQERAAGRMVTGVLLRNMIAGANGDYYTVINSREATANQPQLVVER